ncbi:unnamed protein product [Sympodiomycopsis kandeliae]
MSDFKLQDTRGDDWNHLAEEYEEVASGPSTISIKLLVERTNALLPYSRATGVIDNGCGPGPVISRLIQEHGHDIPETCSLLAADFSKGMVAQVEERKKKAATTAAEGAMGEVWARVRAQVLDATDLSAVPDSSQSHVLAGWVYFMTPDPARCLTESLRVLTPGGVLGCTSWEGSQWLDVMNTLSEVRQDKQLPELPEKWSNVELLKMELENAGFRDVTCERVLTKMQFKKHETLAEFLLTKMPHVIATTKSMSAEEMDAYKQAAIRKCKEYCPNAPGELQGWSLMALGRK